jgi:hypothetical protein
MCCAEIILGAIDRVLSLEERAGIIEDARRQGENLSLSIRDLLLSEISSDVTTEQPAVARLATKIREEMSLFPMTKHEAFKRVAGVDAGSQILPLASKRYGVVSALVYGLPGCTKFWMHPESMSLPYGIAGNRFEGMVNARREAKLYETAAVYLKTHPETELLLVDGPLAFSDWWMMAGCHKDQKRLLEAINNLLHLSRETGVILAGVVKRPSARYLIYYLGLQGETQLPDSFVLLHALKPGERTDIFSPKAALTQASRAANFMGSLDVPIYSFYGRMTKEWSFPPIRVDLPAHSLGGLDDVADYCYGTALNDGIPLPIVKADEGVKITRRFMAEIYGEILSKVSRRTGEIRGLAPYWGEGRWMGA